jgi:hypothetical protein
MYIFGMPKFGLLHCVCVISSHTIMKLLIAVFVFIQFVIATAVPTIQPTRQPTAAPESLVVLNRYEGTTCSGSVMNTTSFNASDTDCIANVGSDVTKSLKYSCSGVKIFDQVGCVGSVQHVDIGLCFNGACVTTEDCSSFKYTCNGESGSPAAIGGGFMLFAGTAAILFNS